MNNSRLLIKFIFIIATLGVFFAPLSSANQAQMFQNFQQVEIAKVVEAVSKISGRNFIIDPRVKGKVTLIAPESMNSEDLYETLLAVLNVHGFVVVEGNGVTKIVPANLAKDQLPYRTFKETDENWVTEVISVRHVEASKLVAILRPLVAREGHLVAMAESNRLIVTDTIANIKRLKSVLKRVDTDVNSTFEVIQIQHASAEDILKMLKTLNPANKGGLDIKMSFDSRANRIILMGDEQKRLNLRALIAELDVPVASEGRVQVIYLKYAKAKDLLPVLQKIAGNKHFIQSQIEGDQTASIPVTKSVEPSEGKATAKTNVSSTQRLETKEVAEHTSIEADERMNAIVISAPTEVVKALRNVIKQLDVRRAQVLIEAIFVEVTEERAADLGIEWGLASSGGIGLINFSGAIPALLGNLNDPVAQSSAIDRGVSIGIGNVNDSNRGWGALVRALNSDTDSNILATPSILTLDNEEAEILVGREVPFQTGSYTSTSTSVSNPFSTIERKNVGLRLTVKPQINEGDEVYLDIDQEISDVIPKGEAVDIQTTKRQIKTRVMVGDGNVVVLGGLINEKETDVESKVPGLGDLPGLGALFRSSERGREKVNLMMFLRPLIVRTNQSSDDYSQLKYSEMYRLQQDLIDRTNGRWGEKTERTQLPSFEQLKGNTSQRIPPMRPQISQPESTDKSHESKTLNFEVYEMSNDELLGL
jgi:general secretion pathway protein D